MFLRLEWLCGRPRGCARLGFRMSEDKAGYGSSIIRPEGRPEGSVSREEGMAKEMKLMKLSGIVLVILLCRKIYRRCDKMHLRTADVNGRCSLQVEVVMVGTAVAGRGAVLPPPTATPASNSNSSRTNSKTQPPPARRARPRRVSRFPTFSPLHPPPLGPPSATTALRHHLLALGRRLRSPRYS